MARSKQYVHLDIQLGAEEPGETECREAGWSQGRACKDCGVKCYRNGWSKQMVGADNKRLVAANTGRLTKLSERPTE